MNIQSDVSVSRPVQPWRYFWWLVIVVVVGWQSVICVRACWHTNPQDVSDFTAFYGAGRLALRGENIYDFKHSNISRRPYLYPPTFAVFPMMPLALLSHNAALIVFVAINQALLFGVFWMLRDALWRWVPQTSPPAIYGSAWQRWLRHPDSGMMLAAVICFRFVDNNLRHGNANMFVAFGITLGLWLMLQNRRPWREFSSGVAIALATAIKVTPGLFGLYLLWTWRKRGMVGGALGLVFFLLLVPALPMGFSQAIARLKEYKAHIASAATGEDAEQDPIGHEGGADQKQLEGGISLRGSLTRYLTPKPMHFKDKLYYANIVDWPETTVRRICQILEFLLFGATVFLTARKVARSDLAGIALSWGLIATAMLLISPLTRKAHLCALLIPAAVAIALMQQDRICGWARTLCISALAATCLQGVVFSVNFIGKLNSDWVQMMGIGFWMLLGVYFGLAVALWKLEPLGKTADVFEIDGNVR